MTGQDVTILLLAAGASRRMRGTDKLLEDIDGRPLLAVMAGRAAKAAPVRVVLGPGQAARRDALQGQDVTIVEAAAKSGMAGSIRAGLVGLDAAGAMIVLADMPEIAAADMHRLIALWQAGAAPILRGATADGRPGHPVVVPRALFDDLRALSGDRGAAAVLAAHRDQIGLVPLEGARAVTDLDTPEDWAAWHAGRRPAPSR